MSDVKPTPIPWEVKKYRPDDTSTIHGANGAVVCIVYDRDAPLISAAPEMLAMLKECHLYFEIIHMDEATRDAGLWQGPMVPGIIDRLAALLAKVEGNAP
jgi:hypothetical protein